MKGSAAREELFFKGLGAGEKTIIFVIFGREEKIP
jgi:hypothetical protein